MAKPTFSLPVIMDARTTKRLLDDEVNRYGGLIYDGSIAAASDPTLAQQVADDVAASASAAQQSADDAALYDGPRFDTVTDFFSSTSTFTAGTYVRTDAEGFAYRAVDTATATTVENAGGQAFEVLKRDGKYNLAAFGCALEGWDTNDDSPFAKAVAAHRADRDSTIWHPGGFLTLTGTTQLGPIRIDGVGYYSFSRNSYTNPNYDDPANFAGSIIRMTATTGVCLDLGDDSITGFNYGVSVNNILMVGPGTGSCTAVAHSKVVCGQFKNVAIANFPVGVHWKFSLIGTYTGCQYWGNEIGLLSDYGAGGNNANNHIGQDFSFNETHIVARDGIGNSFVDGVFERAKVDAIKMDTTAGGSIRHWSFRNNWFEGKSPFLTGYLMNWVGGNDIESIKFLYNRIQQAGGFNLLGGTNNQSHVFNYNENVQPGVFASPLVIPVGAEGFDAIGNVGIPVTDDSRFGYVRSKGAFTGTLTGLTTSPTASVLWVREGRMVTLYLPSISGTSNATSMSLTGLPNDILPASQNTHFMSCPVLTGDGAVLGRVRVEGLNARLSFGLGFNSGFASSGTKGLFGGQITYSTTTA